MLYPENTQPYIPQHSQNNNQNDFQNNVHNNPQSSTFSVEKRFSNSLTESMNSFKRKFNTEFSALFRNTSLTNQPLIEVNEFTDSLKAEIESIITTPINPIDINSNGIQRKIGTAIDEQTRPFTTLLADADQKISQATEHHLSELRQLQEELDTLKNVFKNSTEGVLRELERENHASAAIRDAEQGKASELERRASQLQYKSVELETKANHQNSEKEILERSIKAFEQKRREWEEEELPMIYDEGGALRARILQELSELKREIGKETFESLNQAIDDGLTSLREEAEGMRNELMSLEMSTRWIANQSQEMSIRTPRRTPQRVQMSPQMSPQITPQRSIQRRINVNHAQETMDEIRRKRNSMIQDISDFH